MQAIKSQYFGPTNTRGSRIKASCERGSISLPWPDELSGDAAHVWAVDQLIARFVKEDAARYGSSQEVNPWTNPRACGQMPDGSYAHVFVPMGAVKACRLIVKAEAMQQGKRDGATMGEISLAIDAARAALAELG